jgi:hypothetical protein
MTPTLSSQLGSLSTVASSLPVIVSPVRSGFHPAPGPRAAPDGAALLP